MKNSLLRCEIAKSFLSNKFITGSEEKSEKYKNVALVEKKVMILVTIVGRILSETPKEF